MISAIAKTPSFIGLGVMLAERRESRARTSTMPAVIAKRAILNAALSVADRAVFPFASCVHHCKD